MPANPNRPLLQHGRYYLAGTGLVNPVAATGLVIVMENPANSGRHMYVDTFIIYSSLEVALHPIVNPIVLGLTLSPRAAVNTLMSSTNEATGTFKTGTGAIAVGNSIQLSSAIVIPAGWKDRIELPPYVLPPGTKLGINVPRVASGHKFSLNAYWWETYT